MRIAVVFKDRCQPKRCHLECIAFCPPQRTGTEVIWIDPESGKAAISEETCISCGICVKKCPFDAIRIIGLPEALKEDLVHQYGKNAFRLFRLPVPKKGEVIGLLGPNGIGKTTCVGLLSGEVAPNLGHYRRKKAYWEEVLDYFAGTELHDYLEKIADKRLTTAIKPQYVDKLSKVYSGRVRDLLSLSIVAAIAIRCSSPPDNWEMSRSRNEPSSREALSSGSRPRRSILVRRSRTRPE